MEETMKTYLLTVFVIASVAIFYAAPAHAQATRTWVSGVGDDVNPCSRTAPCKTFAGAISKTATNGEINCLDSGGFGAVTITKSITIKCEGVIGGILAAGTNGVNINDPGGTAIVTLSGLDLEGTGTGINGIQFTSGAVLHVHKTQIRGFRAGGNGINFIPTGTAELYVADSYITDNGATSTTGAIVIRPTAAASATVTVNRTQIENNSIGIRADSSATTGTIHGIVRDSLVAGSTNNGITAVSTATVSTLMVDKVSVVGNNYGLVVNGTNASQLVTNTSVIANNTGLFVNGTGTIVSYYRTNFVNNNTINGTFTSILFPD
jgi:hypothetical protein